MRILGTDDAEHWNLEKWFELSGIVYDKEVIDVAFAEGFTPVAWLPSTLTKWKKGRDGSSAGINYRTDAIAMIKTLRECAKRYERPLFTNDTIVEQSTLFLRSEACLHKFAALDSAELMSICGASADISLTDMTKSSQLVEVRQMIQPAPPLQLFGRDDDINTILQNLQQYALCAIDGVGGDGKTALAWHTAVQAANRDLISKVAWVTDKRYFVDATGKIHAVVQDVDHDGFLEKICTAMVKAFRWVHLYGALGERLINGCADKLRKEPCLIIVDNLETVESGQAIIDRLASMLVSNTSKNSGISKALITSREQVVNTHSKRYELHGLDFESTQAYIAYLQTLWLIEKELTPAQIQRLLQSTSGNPLMLQIALQRYSIMQTDDTFSLITSSIDNGTMQILKHIFEPFIARLTPEVLEFAKRLSVEFAYSQSDMTDMKMQAIWNAIENHTIDYHAAISELVRSRILNWSGENRFTMHAIIRGYLLYLSK